MNQEWHEERHSENVRLSSFFDRNFGICNVWTSLLLLFLLYCDFSDRPLTCRSMSLRWDHAYFILGGYGPSPSPSLQESRHSPPSSHHPTKLPPCVACLPTNRRFAVNPQPRRRPSSATRCRAELQGKGCWLTLSPPIRGSFFSRLFLQFLFPCAQLGVWDGWPPFSFCDFVIWNLDSTVVQ